MSKSVRDVMTANPVTVSMKTSVAEAARTMRDSNIGAVMVVDNGHLCGMVTDRDIVVRGLAGGQDPSVTAIGRICSRQLTTVSPLDDSDEVVRIMREKAIRRVPVVEDGRPVGILSLGDMARERDRRSALAAISTAPPNR